MNWSNESGGFWRCERETGWAGPRLRLNDVMKANAELVYRNHLARHYIGSVCTEVFL